MNFVSISDKKNENCQQNNEKQKALVIIYGRYFVFLVYFGVNELGFF